MPLATFLSLDGIDGTGKTTLIQKLVTWLTSLNLPVTSCVDPGGTELGAKLREILLHGRTIQMNARTEALLFMASRAELVATVIRPALDRGEIVISDRYLLANVVYQGHAGGLDPADLWRIGQFATSGILPHLTLVLDLPVEQARSRRGRAADRMESRGSEYDERVRKGFLDEVRTRPDTHILIDANADLETVWNRVKIEVERFLRTRGYRL